MTEFLVWLIGIALTILMVKLFGWMYLFVSIAFALGWVLRGWDFK